jgi:hypothetical protein
MLSVTPLKVALVSDAIAQAEQVRNAAAEDTIAIVYQSDKMTLTGLVDLLASVSAAHDGAPIGHLGIAAHGSPGRVDLGTGNDLSLSTLPSELATFERLQSLLTSGARLDLYACSVAAGANGKIFVDELSAVGRDRLPAPRRVVNASMERHCAGGIGEFGGGKKGPRAHGKEV